MRIVASCCYPHFFTKEGENLKKPSIVIAGVCLFAMLTGCATQASASLPPENQSSQVQSNTEELVVDSAAKSQYELREGTHVTTLETPDDLPSAYDYSTGFYTDATREQMMQKLPMPIANETVLNTAPDTTKIQALYLWELGNVPAQTVFTENMTGYFDSYDFRPYVTAIPVRGGTPVKGAVILMAGGAYSFRGNYTDTLPTAVHLRELGYQTFIVDYRLRPYTQQEGAVDVARVVRFVRQNADSYGINPDDIAVMGYSAGGIQAGEFLINFDEVVNGTALDADYLPDALDSIPAHASAAAMIYSFYGRLSVASLDVDSLQKANLPPTFYCYGTEDPFYNQFEAQVSLMEEVGITTKTIVLNDWPHGFGGDGGWVETFAQWLESIFAQNKDDSETNTDIATSTTVGEIIADPAFGNFGRLLFPVDRTVTEDMTLADVSSSGVYVWYSELRQEKTVEIIQSLKNRAQSGEQIFYSIYSETEIAADKSKADTGLFFFGGDAGAPFAIMNAGGGFAYVGAMHDSFPHALEVSKKGYNAFALIYRPDYAYEDLAQAIAYIYDHAEELQVATKNYSLWGGSAGARMAATLGNAEVLSSFDLQHIPQAAAVVMQYTGYTALSSSDAPTYACVGTNDGIASWQTMQVRLKNLQALGINTEFHAYNGLGHGFGLGTGTTAEGWLDDAVAFWERQMK